MRGNKTAMLNRIIKTDNKKPNLILRTGRLFKQVTKESFSHPILCPPQPHFHWLSTPQLLEWAPVSFSYLWGLPEGTGSSGSWDGSLLVSKQVLLSRFQVLLVVSDSVVTS